MNNKYPSGRLAGKVAIVTGGNSGMGAATVETFIAEGARVVIAARGEEAGKSLAKTLGENAIFSRTDVTIETDVKNMIDKTLDRWGRLDILFNNAGQGGVYRNVEEFDAKDFDRKLWILLGSNFLTIKYAAPIMKKQRCGSIINNGSTAGVTTDGSSALYSAAKAAVIHMTKIWSTELAPWRIRVNCISPGGIVTPIFWGGHTTHSKAENETRTQRLEQWFEQNTPQRRAGQPEDIAGAALFFAADDSPHVTGQNLVVDGGWTSRMGTHSYLQKRKDNRSKFLETG